MGKQVLSDFVELTEVVAPAAAPSARVRLYAKADGRFYGKDDVGVEFAMSGASGVAAAVLAAAAATSGITETLLHRLQVPVGAAVGDAYRIKLTGNSSSTGTLIFRCRVGALGTTGDAQAWVSTTSAAQVANARAGVELLLVVRVIGATGSVMVDGVAYAGAVVLPTLIGAPATATVVTTAAWWIDVDCTCSSGTFTAQVASIEKVK